MRESGYYWIKIHGSNIIGDKCDTENGWEVAYYVKGEAWYSMWNTGAFQDEELCEINGNRIL
jgi:hypothetical protein